MLRNLLAIWIIPVPMTLGCARPAASDDPDPAETPATEPDTSSDDGTSPSPENPGADPDTGADADAPDTSDETASDRRPGAIVAGMDPRKTAETLRQLVDTDEHSREVVVELRTTLDYGCPCPTWSFVPMYNGPPHGFPYAMVLPADDLDIHPLDYAVAGVVYRMRGHFDGRTMTGEQWVEALGRRPPNYPEAPEPRTYWTDRDGPVFIVEDWCYIPTDIDYEYDRADRLREEGPTCDIPAD